MIPKRIRACTGSGLIVLIGNTVGTLSRNILDPMRNIWGEGLVGQVSGSDSAQLFGRKCYLLGADRCTQVSKLQGAGIEYAYGDEITTWCEEMFGMLKSRLDKPNSRFDGTCNPERPNHWFKRFLDSGADIFLQTYTIDDNPFLDPAFVSSLKAEYAGTVYYDRYIKGLWCAAEGHIYRRFADSPGDFALSENELLKSLGRISIGVDFGGTLSGTSFVALGFTKSYDNVIALASERHTEELDGDKLCEVFCDFCTYVLARYGSVHAAYCDSAESVLIRTLKSALQKRGIPISVRSALKSPINERIRLLLRLMAQNRFFYTDKALTVRDALCDALYDRRGEAERRLDDGSTDIDTLDALEYCLERETAHLIR